MKPRPFKFYVDKKGCYICTSHKPGYHGYPQARRAKIGCRTTQNIHRIIWVEYNGDIPDGMIVRHKCDNRMCINPDHLILGTNRDNSNDMVSRNRQSRGEKNCKAKLTASDVIKIRRDKRKQIEIAADYGIRQTQVSRIQRGEHWGFITEGYREQ